MYTTANLFVYLYAEDTIEQQPAFNLSLQVAVNVMFGQFTKFNAVKVFKCEYFVKFLILATYYKWQK